MASKKEPPTSPTSGGFRIVGQVRLLDADPIGNTPALTAIALDPLGGVVGSGPITKEGQFDIQFQSPGPMDIDLVVGPTGADSANFRTENSFTTRVMAHQWQSEGQTRLFRFNIELPRVIWFPWLPIKVCISGHVRKTITTAGKTTYQPVPYVKVEVFDVDRTQLNLRKLFPSKMPLGPVLRIPKLIPKPKFPPDPDPGPEIFLPHDSGSIPFGAMADAEPLTFSAMEEPAHQALEFFADKTITSRLAPWRIFPISFYSKQLVATTNTNCSGFFNTCFTWNPFHFRHGRLRYDARPDIILRVTQIINGVATVIYLDPYTQTRWNTTSTHIDLYLDDERIISGSGNCQSESGSPVFFTRIGNDEVYQIDQNTGLYEDATDTNVAYGTTLAVHGVIGDALSSGTPKRYYRLSVAKSGDSNFVPLTTPLSDTRVSKTTFVSESYALGPQTIQGTNALYEVRNKNEFYWYNPDLLAIWNTHVTEEDSAKVVLRLEVFDHNGVKLTSANGIEYLDGTAEPDDEPLPPMTDRCDLVITIDNHPPEVNLQIPAATNECGVIPWTPSLQLNFGVDVSQPSQRLRGWSLSYVKGLGAMSGILAMGQHPDGQPGTVHKSVSGGTATPPPGTNMLANLGTTCAFSLTLWAQAHIRNGHHFVYETSQTKTIAVEKCDCS